MAFVRQDFDQISGSRNNSIPNIFGYVSTTDAIATILASAYFNEAKKSFPTMKIGDLIVVNSTDESSEFLKVTAVSPNVTTIVETQTTIPDGVVTNAKVAANAAIAFTKLADLNEGFLLKGDAGNKASAFNAKNAGNIIVGDGTTVDSLPVTGDVTLDGGGFIAIRNKGKHNFAGGSATITITATGVVATDIAFANIESSANAVSIQKVTPGVNQIVVLASGDPGAAVIAWEALRAAS